MHLRVTGAGASLCPDQLIELAGWRVVSSPFVGGSTTPAGDWYALSRGQVGGGFPMTGPSVPLGGRFRVEGRSVVVDIPEHSFAAEAALRIIWSLATANEGGFLIHASGIAVDGHGALVTGMSGAGKSTLARHSAAAGATVLSDEIVQVFPDGTIRGTPFRSEPDIACSDAVARLEWIFTPQKAGAEQVLPWSAAEALRLVIEQTYHEDAVSMPRAELRRRQMESVGRARLGQLACRNDPEAGRFLVSLLRAPPSP